MVSIRSKRTGGFDQGDFTEKIITLTSYDMKTLSKLYRTKSNRQAVELGAANLVSRYFESYIDAKARANPSELHHMYEFDKTGNQGDRLFKRNVKSTPEGAVISYSFKMAKNPNREGYMFSNKAKVMEDGEPIVILPKRTQYLKYRLKSGKFVQSSMSYVPNPGGNVGGNFQKELKLFTSSKAKAVLKEYRYFERISEHFKAKRKLVIPRINSKAIRDAEMQATADAAIIAQQTAVMGIG